ncbi:error-prone DNA polymerase [Pseudomonas matsuisoli]|uniref:Error-prone DNA polymerase n=1 Tax=Pseudomonas matsuisoli TaxID=1515666 RepID=A0A917V138_9PSED|nr:error-prone DNA polymerase [Pseudomonas matsuisoli]GGK07018.1 error-prone DNA polymerase [Pseudomonas matsuisoli]
MSGYAELHCLSNFTFQRGASSAMELFQRAKQQGYEALAITDECTLAGIVRAWQASKKVELPLIVGSEMAIENGPRLVVLVETLEGYQNLCRMISAARGRAEKGTYRLLHEDLQGSRSGLLALWLPDSTCTLAHGHWLKSVFADRLWLAVELHQGPDDRQRLRQLSAAAAVLGIPMTASGDVHMHARGRRALQDTMTAIRHHCTVAEAGFRLFPNGERHLRSLETLVERYLAELMAETLQIAQRCQFGLDQLEYEYPHEVVGPGHTPTSWLRQLTEQGIRNRWPEGITPDTRTQIEKELALIAELKYESYFLTVQDVVVFARSQGILCQGRGSAANSAVCFALGITELDPSRVNLLFERFISRERNEPPDIDVDFEHERREEVIQYVFKRYGRHRAAITAVASTYHGAGAVRDVAKALGLPPDQVNALADCCGRWTDQLPPPERLREAGFDPESPIIHKVMVLTGELIGFPRHLSQHPGGFVISEQPLTTLVPVENASMPGRTVIQWDKDDLDLVGLLKVDILALGMLTALRRCFDLIAGYRRRPPLTIANIPAEDARTYEMISRADTMGVFQIESRAQMSMLPRLRPEKFYDLVIEVAIVRPGPIVGDMVHPYLRRRNGQEDVTYPNDKLKKVFERTLGVPLFQEQVMELAIVAADYTPGEADQLRRSMAAWKRHGGLEPHQKKLMERMRKNGYTTEFATRIFEQIKGFGSYGFPESHAASFALITYASCWLKCHEPAAFTAALINSWPMGFYSPDQLLQNARRHGIGTLPVDVRYSDWDCTLEGPERGGQPSIRMGMRMIRGFREADAQRICQARARAAFTDVDDLSRRADLERRAAEQLADAGALRSLAGHRHRARWAVSGIEAQRPLFDELPAAQEIKVALPLPTAGEDLQADYSTLGTTLGQHPIAMLRSALRAQRCRSSRDLRNIEHGRFISVAGLVVGRQRPGTAGGTTFVTLEDEFGMVNVVVWRDLCERQRRPLLESRLMKVEGRLESENNVIHLIARRLYDLTPLLTGLDVRSRDFH